MSIILLLRKSYHIFTLTPLFCLIRPNLQLSNRIELNEIKSNRFIFYHCISLIVSYREYKFTYLYIYWILIISVAADMVDRATGQSRRLSTPVKMGFSPLSTKTDQSSLNGIVSSTSASPRSVRQSAVENSSRGINTLSPRTLKKIKVSLTARRVVLLCAVRAAKDDGAHRHALKAN